MRRYMRHNEGPECHGCQDRLSEAHPYLAEWFKFRKLTYQDLHVSWAFRDKASQDQAFADGDSKLRWPLSKHNKEHDGKPQALAVDVFQIKNGKAVFDPIVNVKIWEESKRGGYTNLRWGGDFKDLGDSGHFEISLT